MELTNHFRFIGMVYGNPEYKEGTDGKKRTRFTLIVRNDPKNPKDRTFVPLIAYDDLAIIAGNKCRNGNVVCVNGRIKSVEKFDFDTGKVWIQLSFICEQEILVIRKVTKTKINTKRVEEVNKWFCPDDED